MWVELFSPYLITIFLAWVGSHLIKYATGSIKNEKQNFRSRLFMSGGMPSSHSTTVVALLTIIGLKDGVGSGLFSIAALFALIVMYDAAKVRRSSGEQGKALHKLIREQKSEVGLPYTTDGHTPIEVTVGAIFGLVIGMLVYFLTIG